MLEKGEYIYIKSYVCESTEDVYDEGEVGEVCSLWTGRNFRSRDMKFKSIEAALRQVMEENCFKWRGMDEWTDYHAAFDEDKGRFETSVLVDVDNQEATPVMTERWERGEARLYSCHVDVCLGIRRDRDFDEKELSELAAEKPDGE